MQKGAVGAASKRNGEAHSGLRPSGTQREERLSPADRCTFRAGHGQIQRLEPPGPSHLFLWLGATGVRRVPHLHILTPSFNKGPSEGDPETFSHPGHSPSLTLQTPSPGQLFWSLQTPSLGQLFWSTLQEPHPDPGRSSTLPITHYTESSGPHLLF